MKNVVHIHAPQRMKPSNSRVRNCCVAQAREIVKSDKMK